jgi:uncharacterized phage protein (TIGR01671 family)
VREIKFRAWHGLDNKWLHNYAINREGCSICGENILMGNWLCECRLEDLNDIVVEQYTGLKDKNGREIYEGDIVAAPFNDSKHRTKIFNYPVVFTAGNPLCTSHDPRFTFEWWKDFSRNDYRWIPLLSDCEVIGNIHENPDLLDAPGAAQ